jgi:DNA-binding MurR/RpiR family transcriptional regulator
VVRPKIVVTEKMRRQIAGAVAEIDLAQIEFVRRMTPAERVHRAADMIESAERVGIYRLRHRHPELSEDEALRIMRGGLLEYYRKRKR